MLRVITAPGGLIQTPDWNAVNGVFLPYLPKTVTRAAELPEHALFGAQLAVSPPEGVGLLKAVTPPAPATGLDAPGNTVDGSASTFATLTKTDGLGAKWRISASDGLGQIVGARLTYHLSQTEGGAGIRLSVEQNSVNAGSFRDSSIANLDLQATDGTDPSTVTLLLPPDARHGAFQFFALQLSPRKLNDAATTLKVHEVTFLAVDEDAAGRVAQSYLQLPFSTPAEVTLPDLVPPAPDVTVLGSPDGDVTGEATLFEYEHSPDRVRTTRIRLGSTGQDPALRVLKWMVNQ